MTKPIFHIIFCACVCICFSVNSYAQTSLQGNIVDDITNEAILFGTVALFKNEVLITGTETDFDGNYYFSNLEPGTYEVEARYVGYTSERQVGVVVKAGRTNQLNFRLTTGVIMDEVVIKDYKAPLIEIDNTTSGGTVTSETIRNLPTKNINQIAATTAGLSSIDGGAINVRGSRSNATDYYIDGIRVSGLIPESEIEQMQVLTGGLPASYGDVTGGVISITSKGPSAKMSGGIELESSEMLDNFGYNQARGNLSGPILKKSTGESVIGFRMSGQYFYREDDRPSALGVYRFSEEQIRALEEEPFRLSNGVQFPTSEFLRDADIGAPLKTRPNEDRTDIDLTAKLDFRITPKIDVSVSGSYDDAKNRFTPGRARSRLSSVSPRNSWGLLNWTNNPTDYQTGYRGNIRFRHKIGSQGFDSSEAGKTKSRKTKIRNASYTVQVGYENRKRRQEDFRHEDDLFRYGYLGSTERTWNPTGSIVSDTTIWGGQEIFDINGVPYAHLGYTEVEEGFTPNSEINGTLSQFNTINGSITDPLNNVWSNLYSNVGQVYNTFFKSESERYTANISGRFDLLPGGSEKGRHNIEFGAMFESRVNRSYRINPYDLWTLARLNANRHIIGVDTSMVIGSFVDRLQDGSFAEFDQYQTLLAPDNNLLFFKAIRDLTGQSLNEYVNVDALSPDDLSLDMFSAGELNDFNIVNYQGYDHLGNKINSSTSFEDFFTSTDGEGRRTYSVAPAKPLYGAFYLQDKFTFKDIIFRIGVRVDYYDANTKVLKDPYSLYEIETAKDFYTRTGQTQPAGVADDYRVYIEGPESTTVVGLRQGDQWFLPNGTSVTNGSELFGGGVVTPSIDGIARGLNPNIQADDFDINFSFEDYKAQINVMPRLAFSFPISSDAGFFAHYDVLVQRPGSNTNASALDYFYFSESSRTPSANPGLLPTKTVDYEVGFQQKLSQSSAIKVSAYYKEQRAMVQNRFLANTFPVSQYDTFDNLDFATVKGFSFNYDLRRTNNLELQANYTLQFADGSGSDANSSQGLNSRGVIRTLSALSFDERHTLNAILDYRFGKGRSYNGPRIADKEILSNFGINMQMKAVSGRPYTSTRTVQPVNSTTISGSLPGGSGFNGGINEARLPWSFVIDMQADKSFHLLDNGKGKPLRTNIYLRIQNILDMRNVVGVNSFSGDPDNDGYLESSFGQDRQQQVGENGQNVQNFIDAYSWRLLQNGFYTQPRRISLGIRMDF